METTQLPVEIEDFVDVESRASALGLNPPTALCFLPRNIADAATTADLLHEETVTTLRILLRNAKVVEKRLEPDGVRIPTIQQKNIELILPTLFVAGMYYSTNPQAVNIALGVIANYVTDFFKGMGGDRRVRFSVVIKDKHTGVCKRYKYSGDPAGVKDFTKVIERINDGDTK